MAEYLTYPAVDEEYRFPPEVRQAIASSPEVLSSIDSQVDSSAAEAVGESGSDLRTALLTELTTVGTQPVGKGELAINVLDYPSVQAAVDAAPAGGTVLIPRGATVAIGQYVRVNKALTIEGGGTITTSLNGQGFDIQVSNVTIRNITVIGVQPTSTNYLFNSRIVRALGVQEAPLDKIVVENVRIKGTKDTAIHLEWVTRTRVEGCNIEDFSYAGIMLLSAYDCQVLSNTVKNAVQGSTNLSYGIAVSDLANTPATRSARIVIDSNIVEGVKEWEGIDTHGAIYVTISNNVITRCRRAVVCGVGSNIRTTAPEFHVINGNTIDGSGITIGPSAGISFAGRASLNLYCSGTIVGNTFANCANPLVLLDYNPAFTVVQSNSGGQLEFSKDNYDLGWVALAPKGSGAYGLDTGWTSNSGYPARYRISMKNGVKTIQLDGLLSRGTGWTSRLMTLPPEAIPAVAPQVLFSTMTSAGAVGSLIIYGTGAVNFVFTTATTDAVVLSGTATIN